MNVFARVVTIELVRILSLAAAAASAFPFAVIIIGLLNIPVSTFYGRLGLEHWQETVIVLLIAYSPVILIANVPGIAASSFDVRFGARRLSQREMDIIAKVERVLEDCASKSGVKLPRAVWRVQDTGEINAYAYAHNRVCFTKGILHKYSDTEAGIERLAGVAAHELGHLRNWDTRINMYLHYLSLPVNFGIGLTNNTLGKIPFIGLVFMLATVLFRIPCDIAHMLNGSVSTFREYQADRFAAKLMNGVGISGFLDDTTHTEERQGDTFTQWAMRSHPPSELRHDELVKAAN